MRKCTLSLVIVGLLAVPAAAQKVEIKVNPGAVFTAAGGSKLILLQSEDVQKDIKLSDEQLTKAKGLFEKQRNAYKDLPKEKDELTKRLQEIQKESQEREKEAGDLLKPEQLKRLDQIVLQQQGASAMMVPKIAEELKLTDDQKTKVKEAIEESAKGLREAFKGGQLKQEEFQKMMAEFRTKSMEKAAAVLTPEQQKQWKEMVGEPFKGTVGNGFRPLRKPELKPAPPVKPIENKIEIKRFEKKIEIKPLENK